ncbi:MAG: hypothetical protein Q8Q06_04060 [bacterium]|nr:hypothetical protein [bacterium]
MDQTPLPISKPQNPTPGVTPGVGFNDHGPRSGHELLSWIIVVAISVIGAYFFNGYVSRLSEKGIEPPPVVNQQQDETAGWQTYKNTKYGYEFKYPENVGVISDYDSSFLGAPTNPEEDLLLISDRERTFHFQVIDGQLSKIKNSVLGEKVLSTFRFIDSKDISTWQTYRNEEFGFELKYPEGWTISVLDEQIHGREGITLNSPARENIDGVHIPSDMRVSIEEKDVQSSLEQFISDYDDGWYSRYSVEEMTTTHGKTARYVKSDIYRPANVFFINNGNYVLIIPLNLDEAYPNMPDFETYEDILNTLVFN